MRWVRLAKNIGNCTESVMNTDDFSTTASRASITGRYSLDGSVKEATKTQRELEQVVHHMKDSTFATKRPFLAEELDPHKEELLVVRDKEVLALKKLSRDVRKTFHNYMVLISQVRFPHWT